MTVPLVEESIGPYKTVCKLGEGGMGLVYLAHDDELDRAIAIKLLPQHLADDDEQLARLKQEARTASSLNHPNIITIYEIGQHGSSAFIAMEYIDGQTLRDVMAPGPLPIRKTLQIASQIADGLAAAHKRGLMHRDLKPENIMLTSEGGVKILDFGLARSAASGDTAAASARAIPAPRRNARVHVARAWRSTSAATESRRCLSGYGRWSGPRTLAPVRRRCRRRRRGPTV